MAQTILSSFSGGEVSYDLRGKVDIPLYHSSGLWVENYVPRLQGPLEYRGGSQHTHPTESNAVARTETFKFNDEQAYTLEFSDSVLRIYEDGELTLNTSSKNITAATAADPVVITSAAHGFSDGDEVYIAGVVGMTELNGRFFRVASSTTDTFELQDLFDNDVDGSAFTAYTSGGTITSVYTVASPYLLADLFEFQFAQSGNDMYFAHRGYAPRKLTRVSATSWTLGTYTRTADPFTTTDKYPGCVAFFQGRIIFASTNDNPDTVWGSKAPTAAGAAQYDDFTTGSAADDAFVFPIASSSKGDVEYINWLAGTRDFIAIGTTSGVSSLDGGGTNEAITSTNLRVRRIDPYGVQGIMPIANGSTLFYMQKGSRVLRSFEYDLLADAFKSFDRSFLAPHYLSSSSVKQIAFQRGRSDIVWAVRDDGKLFGLVAKPKEDLSGWHRYKIGGDGKVLSITIEPQVEGYDIVRIVVERTINGTTVRYHEFFTDPFEGLQFEDYYTGDKETDIEDFENEQYEKQRQTKYLDSHLILDGSSHAGGSITVTPGAVTGASVTFTASASVFTAADVGKQIWKRYENRAGGGRAVITGYTSGTEVTCKIVSDFDTATAIPAGSWDLTTNSVTGLHHLEGQTVQVLADGRVHPDVTVTKGAITLDRQAGIVVVGYRYRGIYASLPLVFRSQMGMSLGDTRNIDDVGLMFTNSVGTKYGTSLYSMQQIKSSKTGQKTDRPPVPFTGVLSNFYGDSWTDDKQIFIMQDQPYPSFINAIVLQAEVGGT